MIVTDENPGPKIRQSVTINDYLRESLLNRSPGRTTIFSPEGTRVFLSICNHLLITASYRQIIPKYATVSSRLLITDASLDLIVLHALNRNHES